MRRQALVIVLLAISVTVGAGTQEEESMPIIDFSRGDVTWPNINDGVMGGVSSGGMSSGDGYATFRGTVSFENNGGFSSVARRPSCTIFRPSTVSFSGFAVMASATAFGSRPTPRSTA